MKQVKLKISNELTTYLQSIHYEIQMREEIVQKIITDASITKTPLNKMPALKEYEQEIIEKKIKLDAMFEEIKTHIMPMLNGKNVSFTVNFTENCLDISLNDDEAVRVYESNKDCFQGVKSCTLK